MIFAKTKAFADVVVVLRNHGYTQLPLPSARRSSRCGAPVNHKGDRLKYLKYSQ